MENEFYDMYKLTIILCSMYTYKNTRCIIYMYICTQKLHIFTELEMKQGKIRKKQEKMNDDIVLHIRNNFKKHTVKARKIGCLMNFQILSFK